MMGNLSFPWLALGLGLLVAVGLLSSGALSPDGNYSLPLLTMLIVNEFGFFVTAIGAGVGINRLLKFVHGHQAVAWHGGNTVVPSANRNNGLCVE
jgi:hypothetical protein